MRKLFRCLEPQEINLSWIVLHCYSFAIWFFVASIGVVAQELPSEVRKVTLEKDIESDGQLIPFDLGKHLPGSKLSALLQLTNKTAKGLKLFLKPSCNCTDLSVEKLEIPVGGTESIRFEIAAPRAGVTTAYIKCTNEGVPFECSIGLKVEAAQPVKLENDRLVVDSRSENEVVLALEPTSTEYSVSEIELESGSRWAIQKVSLAKGRWAVGLRRNEVVSEGYHEENLRFNCKAMDDRGGAAYVALEFRILYSDRFRLGPSYVVPKVTDERVKFMVFATGANVTKNDLAMKIWVTNKDSDFRTEIAIENTRIRSGSLLIEATMPTELYAQAIKESDGKPLFLELKLGEVSSLTKLQAESQKDPS